ncbi:glycosyltransferase family 4 protein [uncultured Micrococcus sp.]|uniref:glycosyltransferase family 4 protein n=1 Tax=uncultured Micrococcus sp. TaxID=114051 RepID=UPI00261478E4|nr:glycosyltransferase family 4 protein [uncultured Micrococcus sp.]
MSPDPTLAPLPAPAAAPDDRPHMAMLVGNQVVGDSRVEKAAVSAVRAGYRVTIVGVSHRTRFNLDRYGDVPILRVPVAFRRHAAWMALHAGAPEGATDWAAVLPAEEAARMARWDEENRTGAGLPQAVLRGVAPHTLPDAVRGRLSGVARRLDARGAQRAATAQGRARTARAARAAKNFEAGRSGAWRSVWPMIADYEDGFLRALIDLEPDLIHAHDRHPLPAAAAYARYRRAHGLPHVPWVYDAHEWLPGQMMPGPVDQRIGWKAAEAELIHEADAVLAVTDELAARTQAYHRLPERPATVVNAPWSLRAPLSPEERLPLRQECGLADDVPLLVYVGRLAAVRGIFTAVEALPHLPGVHVAFVGSSDVAPRAALRELAESLGVADRVHITDYVPSASVTWYIASATAGLSPLLPTPAHESAVPTKLREYLLAGLPMVVSDLREQAAFVRDQGVGTVAAPGDAVDLARAVRELLAGLEDLRATVRSPTVQDEHRWEGSERALHRVWGSLVPGSRTPREADAAPDRGAEPTPTGLLVVGEAPAAQPLVDAWAAALGPAERRAPLPAPDGPGLVAGGPSVLWDMLDRWVQDDRTVGTVLSTGVGPMAGRAEGSVVRELLAVRARGHRAALLAGERALVEPRHLLLAVPDHAWSELDEETFDSLERRVRRGVRVFAEGAEAGVPVLTHRRLDALLVPGALWLPEPFVVPEDQPEDGAEEGVRSVLVLPGDRTRAETEALPPLVATLEGRGLTVHAPSGPRYRRRPAAFTADVVLSPLHTGDLGADGARALARGATVVSGPLALADRTGTTTAPVVTADDATLTETVLALVDESPRERAARARAGREHHARVHAPGAVARRLAELLAPTAAAPGEH